MTTPGVKIPISVKAPLIFMGLLALLVFLCIAKSIIVPLVYATIITIVLHPVARFFIRIRINRILAIIITLLLILLVITASIIAVIIFAAMWGIPGMLIAVPLTAIAKLMFDHVEPFQTWGFLLGDTMPVSSGLKPMLRKLIKRDLL